MVDRPPEPPWREDYTEDRIASFAAAAARAGVVLTSAAEREAGLRAVLAGIGPGEDLWIFGYGSLMWNPALDVAESRVGTIYGFHRRFCLDLPFGRGSPEVPGLMLALDRGGGCRGVAHRIAAPRLEDELTILWRREMASGAYRPTWVRMHAAAGPLRALTFAIDRRHARYAGALTPDEVARRIAAAAGPAGTNRDYLDRTVACLTALGIRDPALFALRDRAAALASPDEPEPRG
jgi:cation transport protein ChaC